MGNTHYPAKPVQAPAKAGRQPLRQASRPLAAVLAMALAGCGGGETVRMQGPPSSVPSTWPGVAPDDPVAANAVLMRALSLVGTPYRYGGNTPDGGFDCSGLVTYVYRDMLARSLPRSSAELARLGPDVGPERMAAGDLVVFGWKGAVTHVGIYVGEGRFVHAPSTGGTVRLDRLDGPYWRERFQGARRVL